MGRASIIFCAGAAGVGKTTVMRDIVRLRPALYLLEKDVCLESYLHSNPFLLRKPGMTIEHDVRLSVCSDVYAKQLREQVYASMCSIAMGNALLGKSSVLDANFIGWLKDPEGMGSFVRRMVQFYGRDALADVRMPIIYFYVTDEQVVRRRLMQRMASDPVAQDRDWRKIMTDEAWGGHCQNEPAVLFEDLRRYSDILFVDMTEEYADNRAILEQIQEFLDSDTTLAETGFFTGEPFVQTVERFSRQ